MCEALTACAAAPAPVPQEHSRLHCLCKKPYNETQPWVGCSHCKVCGVRYSATIARCVGRVCCHCTVCGSGVLPLHGVWVGCAATARCGSGVLPLHGVGRVCCHYKVWVGCAATARCVGGEALDRAAAGVCGAGSGGSVRRQLEGIYAAAPTLRRLPSMPPCPPAFPQTGLVPSRMRGAEAARQRGRR